MFRRLGREPRAALAGALLGIALAVAFSLGSDQPVGELVAIAAILAASFAVTGALIQQAWQTSRHRSRGPRKRSAAPRLPAASRRAAVLRGLAFALLGALVLTVAALLSGSDQLAFAPAVGALLGWLLGSAAVDLLQDAFDESPTGRSTRAAGLALALEPATVAPGEPLRVVVRVRGEARRPPLVSLRLVTRRAVLTGESMGEREEVHELLAGAAEPAGDGTFVAFLEAPPGGPASSATSRLELAWFVRAELPGGRWSAAATVEAPLRVVVPPRSASGSFRQDGHPPLGLSLDEAVAVPGGSVSGSVEFSAEVGVRSVRVGLMRDVEVTGGPGGLEPVGVPVEPAPGGRFELRVPEQAGDSPTAEYALGSVRWFVRAEADLAGLPNPWAMREIELVSGARPRETTVVDFPPRRRLSAARIATLLVGLAAGVGLAWLVSALEEDQEARTEYTAPPPRVPTGP